MLSRTQLIFLGAIVLLILIAPLSTKSVTVNGVVLFGLIIAVGTILGGMSINYFRDKSFSSLFILTGERRSTSMPGGKLASLSGGRQLPALALLEYDGFSTTGLSWASPSIAVVPSASVEKLDDGTSLIYSPAVPLRRSHHIRGILNSLGTLADASPWISFKSDKNRKSKSEARLSLLNSLTQEVSSDAMEKERGIMSRLGAKMADSLDEIEIGEESNIVALQKLLKEATKNAGFWSRTVDKFRPPTPESASSESKPEQKE